MGSGKRLRRWSARDWRLWQKIVAVVSVPLIAATVFGVLQITSDFHNQHHYRALAGQVELLPALVDFSSGVSGVVAASIIQIPTDQGRALVDGSQESIALLLEASVFDEDIQATLASLVDEGLTLMESASSGSMGTLVAHERTETFVTRTSAAIRAVLDRTENPEALREGAMLLDLWGAQWTMFDQIVAYSAVQSSIEEAALMLQHALATEAAHVSTLSDALSDPEVQSELVAEIENRRVLSEDLASVRNRDSLRTSLLHSQKIYGEGVRNAATHVVEVLDDLVAEARIGVIRNGAGIVIILAAALGAAVWLTLSLLRPLRRLRSDTLRTAHQGLPQAISAIKNGAPINSVDVDRIGVYTREEIGEVARAIDDMNENALLLAGEQAEIRRQVNEMLETLARRNKTLVDQQLSLIDSLEQDEKDPIRLQNLFALDHLAARMRRTGDSLLVLAGTRARTQRFPDTPLHDVLRAAVSQVESYQRVTYGNIPRGYLVGTSVADVVHLVAELLDNALRASPPDSNVMFSFSSAVDGGLLLEIADRGIGIPPEELDSVNARLTGNGDMWTGATRRMGMFVVARLASRHSVTVRLRPTLNTSTNAGITASVYFPPRLLAGIETDVALGPTERPQRLTLTPDRGEFTGPA